MPYIDIPIDTVPTDLADDAFAYIEQQIDGWLPSPGNLDAIMVEALAQLAGELRTLIVLVPDVIFQYLGSTILGLPPYEAVPAHGLSSWTMIDAAGYTVPAGTLIAVTPPSSISAYAFSVDSDFTVAAGATQALSIPVTAVEAGAAASGITGTVEVIDALDFVQLVTLDAPTSGGQDAESSDAYLNRLSDLLTLLAP